MDRRHFITRFMRPLAAAPLAAALDPAQAAALYWKPQSPEHQLLLSSPDTAWPQSFEQLKSGYDSQVAMRVPEGLHGTLFRNGPALMSLGGTRYRHWFDGDAMVHAFRFTPGQLSHRGRMVMTRKLQAEQQAGRRLSPGFGTSLPGTAMSSADDFNTANINVLPLNGELLALWEGGAPYALNPETLATIGRKSFSPQTDALPFSAHPRRSADGRIWSFGYLPGAGALALYELAADGTLARQGFVPAPGSDMVHDFAIAERYLLFVLMPYAYQPSNDPSLSFIGHYAWQRGQPSRVLVVDKASFAPVCTVETEAFGLFHLGNAWESGNTLRFGAVAYDDFPAVMAATADVMDGSMRSWPHARWTEFELDLSTRSLRRNTFDDTAVEFPRFDPRRTGMTGRYLYLLANRRAASAPVFGFDTLRSIDQQTAQVQEYRYASEIVAEEHVFVPAPGATQENRGWLVGIAYDWLRRQTLVSIFDAAAVAQGPIEQVRLPYGLPLGLHGQFQAA